MSESDIEIQDLNRSNDEDLKQIVDNATTNTKENSDDLIKALNEPNFDKKMLNDTNEEGYTPLQRLVKSNPGYVKDLFKKINDGQAQTVEQGQARKILQNNCDLGKTVQGDQQNADNGMTVAGLMCKHGDSDLVKGFHEFASPKTTGYSHLRGKDDNGNYPVHYAAQNENDSAGVINQLKQINKLDLQSKDDNGDTPLTTAVKAENEAAVSALLENNARVMEGPDNFSKPLAQGLRKNNETINNSLLAKAAQQDPNDFKKFLRDDEGGLLKKRRGVPASYKKQFMDRAAIELKNVNKPLTNNEALKSYKDIANQAVNEKDFATALQATQSFPQKEEEEKQKIHQSIVNRAIETGKYDSHVEQASQQLSSQKNADNPLEVIQKEANEYKEKAEKNKAPQRFTTKPARLNDAHNDRQKQIERNYLLAQHAAAKNNAQFSVQDQVSEMVDAENHRRNCQIEAGLDKYALQRKDSQFSEYIQGLYSECAKKTMYNEDDSLKPNYETSLDKVTDQFNHSLNQWEAYDQKKEQLKQKLGEIKQEQINKAQEIENQPQRRQSQRLGVNESNKPLVNDNNGSGPPSCYATTQQPMQAEQIQNFLNSNNLKQAVIKNSDMPSEDNNQTITPATTVQPKFYPNSTIEYYNQNDQKVFDHSISKINDNQYEHKGSLQASKVDVDNIQSFVSYFAKNMPQGPNGEKANMQISKNLENEKLSGKDKSNAESRLKELGVDVEQNKEALQNMTMADYAWLEGKSQGLNVQGAEPNPTIKTLYESAQEPENTKDERLSVTSSMG